MMAWKEKQIDSMEADGHSRRSQCAKRWVFALVPNRNGHVVANNFCVISINSEAAIVATATVIT